MHFLGWTLKADASGYWISSFGLQHSLFVTCASYSRDCIAICERLWIEFCIKIYKLKHDEGYCQSKLLFCCIGNYWVTKQFTVIRPIVVLPSSQAQGQPYVGSHSSNPFYYSASPPPHLLRHQISGSITVSPSSFSSYVSPTEVQSCYSTGEWNNINNNNNNMRLQ